MKKPVYLKQVIIILPIILFAYIIFRNPTEKIYETNIVNVIENKVLVEDFNHKLDQKYWNIVEQGDNPNNELQYYSSKNINVKDGLLSIEARQEKIENNEYTSGLINTKGKFEFLYGKVIFRAKAAIGKGLLSAIWLLPADDSFFPEFDILEVLGSESNNIWTGVHYFDSKSILKSNFVNYSVNEEFSVYEFNWEEKEIRCYSNNKLVLKTNTGVPNKPMYLIVNLAVGGNWPKNPDLNALPSSFLIDYIMIIPKELDAT